MYVISPRFRVAWLIITPGALVALVESQEDPKHFVSRHLQGDWGDVGPEEWSKNEEAVRHGGRLSARYHTRHGRTLRVETGASRFSTTISLPEELPRRVP